MFVIKAHASGGQNGAYSRAAIRQAMSTGMTREQATRLVNRNANANTRTTSRQNFVNRLPASARRNING